MHITWKYLDKRAATIEALRDYHSMQFIIENTEDAIKERYERMMSISSPDYDGMPHVHDPQSGETRLANSLYQIDVLKERYRQAREYMDWFVPAWKALSDDERFCLEEFYWTEEYESRTDAIQTICERLHIERSSAYNKKNRAINHLKVNLYGKG